VATPSQFRREPKVLSVNVLGLLGLPRRVPDSVGRHVLTLELDLIAHLLGCGVSLVGLSSRGAGEVGLPVLAFPGAKTAW